MWLLLVYEVNAEYLPPGERILSFDSVIEVHKDSSLTVSETITVVARQIRIIRGIYRELPTDIFFDVLEVLRDGIEEPYRIEDNRITSEKAPPSSPPESTPTPYVIKYTITCCSTRMLMSCNGT